MKKQIVEKFIHIFNIFIYVEDIWMQIVNILCDAFSEFVVKSIRKWRDREGTPKISKWGVRPASQNPYPIPYL